MSTLNGLFLSLAPLVKELSGSSNHVWYADDATGCDKIVRLKTWFDLLLAKGPIYGYYPKPTKCILVSKPEHADHARAVSKVPKLRCRLRGGRTLELSLRLKEHVTLGRQLAPLISRPSLLRRKLALGWLQSARFPKLPTANPMPPMQPSPTVSNASGLSSPDRCQRSPGSSGHLMKFVCAFSLHSFERVSTISRDTWLALSLWRNGNFGSYR